MKKVQTQMDLFQQKIKLNMKTCVCCYISKELDCFPIVKQKMINTCKACKIEQRNRSRKIHKDKYVKRELNSRRNNPIKAMHHHYKGYATRFLFEGFKSYECVIGIDHQGFIKYIENQFKPWMNWNNRQTMYSTCPEPNKTWMLDHIIPISSAKTEEELIQLSHYTNLQPICSFINNRVKRGQVDYYNVSDWIKRGYRTELKSDIIDCYHGDKYLGSVEFDDVDKFKVIEVWESHRASEYLRTIS